VTRRDFLNFGRWSRCLLRGPGPDGQRQGRHPRQSGGCRDRCRLSGSCCCCCCCRSAGPDAQEGERGRLQEGQHAEDDGADRRSDVELLKTITENNYY
jgi:hypothetical protein